MGELDLQGISPREPPLGERPAGQHLAPRRVPGLGVKKRVKLDMEGSRAATELPGDVIRALIQDRAPLLRDRSHMSLAALRCQLAFPPDHVVSTLNPRGLCPFSPEDV